MGKTKRYNSSNNRDKLALYEKQEKKIYIYIYILKRATKINKLPGFEPGRAPLFCGDEHIQIQVESLYCDFSPYSPPRCFPIEICSFFQVIKMNIGRRSLNFYCSVLFFSPINLENSSYGIKKFFFYKWTCKKSERV